MKSISKRILSLVLAIAVFATISVQAFAFQMCNAKGHVYDPSRESQRVYVNATCDKGSGYWVKCNCYKEGVKGGTKFFPDGETPALGHDLGEVEIIGSDDCSKPTIERQSCQREGCNYVKETIIPAGHTVVTDEAVAPTCTETGLTEGTHCSVCNTVIKAQETVDALGHKEVADEAVDASCLEDGKTAGSHCETCGSVIKAPETVKATGHTYDNGVVTKDATCAEDGVKTFTCTACGDTKTEPVAKNNHNYDNGVVTTPATCENEGVKTFTCEGCGDTYTETIALADHTYDNGVVTKAATCTEDGVKTFTCSVCGDSYTESIKATGHKSVKDAAVTATCTKTGLTEGSHCSVCETVLKAQEVVPMKAHRVVTDRAVPATCEKDGKTAGSHCSVCNTVITAQEVVPATGHNWVEADRGFISRILGYLVGTNYVVNDPTCTEVGHTFSKCSNSHCDYDYEWTDFGSIFDLFAEVAYREIPALGHDYDDGVVTTDPTCTEDGVKTFTCNRCQDTHTEAVPATGHTEVANVEVAPTCTETGLTAGTHCSVCDAVLSGTEVIPALGHTAAVDAAVAPTCTETGLTEGSHCSVCNAVLTAQEVVPALGHTSVTDAAVAPTCTETGLTEGSHCSVCNAVLTAQEVVPALGHTSVTDAAVAPTCTETGLTEGSHCSVCNAVLTAQEVVPALGHTEADAVVENRVEPTCTEAGSYDSVVYCSVCDAEISRTTVVLDPLGHTPTVDAAVAPTCTETGLTEGSHCSVCDAVIVPQEVIPATGHNIVIDDATPATSTATGLTEGSHCADCGTVIKAQKVVPVLQVIEDDTPLAPAPAPTDDNNNANTNSNANANNNVVAANNANVDNNTNENQTPIVDDEDLPQIEKVTLDDDTPLASMDGSNGTWSIVNMILCGISLALAAFVILKKSNTMSMILAAVAAIANIAVFFVTQDMSGSMIAFDTWTILNAVIAAVGAASLALSSAKKKVSSK